jgi:iron complex outermembrane receptor protein
MVFAQAGTVQGRVVDKTTREGIVGANVIVGGTMSGTATDIDGNFAIIDVPMGTIKIVVSVIGYAKVDQEVTITS